MSPKIVLLAAFLFTQPIAYASSEVTVAVWDQYESLPKVSDDEALNDMLKSDQQKRKKTEALRPYLKDYILPVAKFVNGTWSESKDAQPEQTWTVTFDGKNLGSCKSKKFAEQPFDAFSNAQEPIGPIPHPDKPKVSSYNHLKSYRPLVLVSSLNYQDPDQWKPSSLNREEAKNLKAEFRKKFSKASNCLKFEKDQKPHLEEFADSDIKFGKVYRSNKNSFVAEIFLQKWGCDSIFDEPFEPHWFGATGNKIKYMSQRLTLIDAGDYNHTGRSKLVFQDASDGGDDDNSRGYSVWDENFVMLAKRIRFLH